MECPPSDYADRGEKIADTIIKFDGIAAATSKAFFTTYLRPLMNCLSWDHSYVLEVLRKDYIKDWEPEQSYNLSLPRSHYTIHSHRQAEDIYNLVFRDRVKNGFFVEAGASQCDQDSVTLPFEISFNWTGLLVEAVPMFFETCKEKRRRAHMVQTCLATERAAHYTMFDYTSVGNFSLELDFHTMAGISKDKTSGSLVQMQCFPIYSLLKALKTKTVNLFVLDVEGAEYQILKTIPFDKVDIEVFDIETDLAGLVMPGTKADIIELMENAGYTRFDHSRADFSLKTGINQNDIFVRNDIVKKYNVKPLGY